MASEFSFICSCFVLTSAGPKVKPLALREGPVPPAGTRLTASARRSGGGRKIFFSTCEVRDRDGRLVATGSATYRYRGDA